MPTKLSPPRADDLQELVEAAQATPDPNLLYAQYASKLRTPKRALPWQGIGIASVGIISIGILVGLLLLIYSIWQTNKDLADQLEDLRAGQLELMDAIAGVQVNPMPLTPPPTQTEPSPQPLEMIASLEANPPTLIADGTGISQITIHVTDHENPFTGSVKLILEGAGLFEVNQSDTLSLQVNDGTATAIYRAGSAPGDVKIKVFWNNTEIGDTTLSLTPALDLAYAITISPLMPRNDDDLIVTIKSLDASKPIPSGVAINLISSPEGLVTFSNSSLTFEDGIATTTATMNFVETTTTVKISIEENSNQGTEFTLYPLRKVKFGTPLLAEEAQHSAILASLPSGLLVEYYGPSSDARYDLIALVGWIRADIKVEGNSIKPSSSNALSTIVDRGGQAVAENISLFGLAAAAGLQIETTGETVTAKSGAGVDTNYIKVRIKGLIAANALETP